MEAKLGCLHVVSKEKEAVAEPMSQTKEILTSNADLKFKILEIIKEKYGLDLHDSIK